MKRSLFALAVTLTAILSTAAHAEGVDKQTLLRQLNRLQIIAYDTTSNFLSYSLEDNKIPYNATEFYANDKAASTEANSLAATIDAGITGLGLTAKPVSPLWARYSEILNNEQLPLVAPGGVLDTFNIAELVKARNAMVSEIDVARKQIVGESSVATQRALEIARKVEEISMTYTARISPEQGTFIAIDPKFDIKKESEQISTLLDDLITQTANDPAKAKLVSEAKTEWLFLSPVLMSDKKIKAASIVSIYTNNIVKQLDQI